MKEVHMKKLVLSKVVLIFLLACSPAVFAGELCERALLQAEADAMKDPNCQVKGKDVTAAYKAQLKTCTAFHSKVKECKQSKQAAKKECADTSAKECKRALEKEKKECNEDVKNTESFATCKDSRKLTSSLNAAILKCGYKNYSIAFLTCLGESTNESLGY